MCPVGVEDDGSRLDISTVFWITLLFESLLPGSIGTNRRFELHRGVLICEHSEATAGTLTLPCKPATLFCAEHHC